MKRLFVLLLAVVMCFSLCACIGENEQAAENEEKTAIANILKEGKWRITQEALGSHLIRVYEFKNSGRYEENFTIISDKTSTHVYTGNFVIEEDKILCTSDSSAPEDEPQEIHYTYEDGHLELTIKGAYQEWELEHLED